MKNSTVGDTLDLQVSERMKEASRMLCDLKYRLDMDSREEVLQAFQNDWMGASNTCAFFGSDFLSVVVPFLNICDEVLGEHFRAMVDCRQVLGASIKGKPRHIAPDSVAGRIAHYSKHHDDGLSSAQYWWYQPLGIFVANEGKHRVAFMRDQGDLPIAARITPIGYPAPDRIRLVKVSGRYWRYFALLDGRYLQVIERPDITRWYLSAYGVKEIASWELLEGVPGLDLICAVIAQGKGEIIDLQELAEFQKETTSRVAENPIKWHDIKGYHFELLRFFAWPTSFFLAGGVAAIVADLLGWRSIELIATGFISGAFGLMMGLSLMRWRKQPELNIVAAWFLSRRRPGLKSG